MRILLGKVFAQRRVSKNQRNDGIRDEPSSGLQNSNYGNFSVEVPQYRKSTFAPQIIPKRQKDISNIDRKIILMYRRDLSTRQISDNQLGIRSEELGIKTRNHF